MALSFASSDGEKYSEQIFYLMSFFFLGAYASHRSIYLIKFLASRWIWLLAPIVIGTSIATAMYELKFGPNWTALSFAGVIFFSAMAQRIENTGISAVVIWVGQRSIVFYVSHAIFIVLTYDVLSYLGVTSYAAAASAAISFALLGGCALAVWKEIWKLASWLFSLPGLRPRLQTVRPT
nr:hypothetical protein [Paracoccus marcusii]